MNDTAEQINIILESGLFDVDYYTRIQRLSFATLWDAVHFYCTKGEELGHSPNLLFDPSWYRGQYRYFGAGAALAHYISVGASSGYEPSTLFDSRWFRDQASDIRDGETALAAYLRSDKATASPNPFFDPRFYLDRNPEVADSEVDPFEHFVTWGIFEGRRPSASFDIKHVARQYLNGMQGANVFRAFMTHYRELGWRSAPDESKASVAGEIKRRVAPNDEFEEKQLPPVQSGSVKAIALYLPQYHRIPENDAWWGPGFTEWTNLGRATPRFKDHYQPRIPRDLGFYDLTEGNILERQIEMASAAGLQGFCFYYYNFNGRTLLEDPLKLYTANPAINFPFCLMWVNENWTRRWDGMEKEVLIESTSDWESLSSLVDSVAEYMSAPNYIRIGDRPVLFVYRGDAIPDTRMSLDKIRAAFSERYNIEPLLVMAQTFGKVDPRPLGFDAALEFPPHKLATRVLDIAAKLETLDPNFGGEVKDYDEIVSASLEDFPSDYNLIKTVLPSWDNDARRQGAGMVIHGSTPRKFQAWVEAIVQNPRLSSFDGEKLLFVNAWNEWCEGAYLEPDVHFGFAYLNALNRGLRSFGTSHRQKIVLAGHDAFPSGSQHLLLALGDLFKRRFGLEVFFILDGGGALLEAYRAIGPTFVAKEAANYWPRLAAHMSSLRQRGVHSAIANTTFSGNLVFAMQQLGFRTCTLIHELATTLQSGKGAEFLQSIFKHSDHVVFPSAFVKDKLSPRFGIPANSVHVLPQGIYKRIAHASEQHIEDLRASLEIPDDNLIVLGVGYADLRKGIDRFIAIAERCAQLTRSITFIWLGDAHPDVKDWILSTSKSAESIVKWVPFTDDIGPYYGLADLLLLPSREDPFPSVVLEALSVGLPVAGFSGCGGFVDLLADNRLGLLFSSENTADAAEALLKYIQSPAANDLQEQRYRMECMIEQFDFATYGNRILNLVLPVKTISVIVPNYNYKRYLERRLASIAEQSYPIFEIIVLDDYSTDGSVAEIERVSRLLDRDITLVENASNSGNVYKQWKLGASMASGDLVWIAEADDIARPGLIEGLVDFFESDSVQFAFCDSCAIDEDGNELWSDHKEYYSTIFPGALAKSAVFDGEEFAANYLSVKNAILNVSAVLWRRDALVTALENCEETLDNLPLAGDWRVYLEACLLGSVGYNAAVLNSHCRTAHGVTGKISKKNHLSQVDSLHKQVRKMFNVGDKRALQQDYMDELQTVLRD